MTGAPAAGAPALVTGSADLVELARGDVEDEAADGVGVRHERTGLDPGNGLPHVLLHEITILARFVRLTYLFYLYNR